MSKLKKNIIRFLSFTIMILFVIANLNYASNKYGKDLDLYSVSSDLNRSQLYLRKGDFFVLGDSYAYLMVLNTKELYHYVVRPGYNVTRLYYELLPRIKPDTFKYAFLFIGPNDYMEQLEPDKFKFVLGLMVDKLIERGIKVIMTDYIEPHQEFLINSNLINADYPIEEYNIGVKEVIAGRNLLYVPMSHLVNFYGFNSEYDLVHPSDDLYEPLLYDVLNCIDNYEHK